MGARIEVPDMVRDGTLAVVASVSGGKDSTALMLALREADVPFRAVFADTGWEAPETYAYLDVLREKIGPIDVVGVPGGMVGKVRERMGFPSGGQRWCTRKLKIEPLRAYHDALGVETVNAMGVRAEESEARAKMPVWADDEEWGGFVWRPLLAWSVADVLHIHHRHGVPVHGLYRAGFSRVGCAPCIFANKDEIRLWSEHWPSRIDEIAALESEVNATRDAVRSAEPGRLSDSNATFFRKSGNVGAAPIRDVVTWSRTTHGGRQLPLLAPPPTGGCMRWGMCEAPPRAAVELLGAAGADETGTGTHTEETGR